MQNTCINTKFDFGSCSLIHCSQQTISIFTIPESIKHIGVQAFARCSQITEVKLPSSIQSIGVFAFEYCKQLRSINLPSSVKYIGYGAFANCTKLKTICIEHIKPPKCRTEDNFFHNIDVANCTLYVPVGAKLAYINAEVWCEFGNIIEGHPTASFQYVPNNDTKNEKQLEKKIASLTTPTFEKKITLN